MKKRSIHERIIAAFRTNFPTWRLLLLSAAIGVMAGLGAIAFHYLLEFAKFGILDVLAGFRPEGPPGEAEVFHPSSTPLRRWILLFLPALGGLLGGLIVTRFAPEAEGHGTDAAIDAFHHRGGVIRPQVPFVKLLASTLTIGTGGSAGREGPIAQIGAGFASLIASYLKIPIRERRILVAAGIAAGVGAIFRAPLAGALFAAEVLYGELDLEYEVIIPSVISSIVGYAVFAFQFGWDPLFSTPDFVHQNPVELLPYLVLAFAVVIGASTFIRCFYFVRDSFVRFKIPIFLKPAIGGLLVGIIGFFIPDALGAGYGIVQRAFDGDTHNVGILLLLTVAVAKVFTTSFSIASGGSGGVFGPSIVIGGAIGGAVGLWMQAVFAPLGVSLEPGAFVVVGMAGFFAAAANTPISTIIMVSEMTGNYQLLVPSMWVCVIAYMMMRRHSLYENQISNRFDAPVHRGDMMDAILKNVSVDDIISSKGGYTGKTFAPSASVHDLLECFSRGEQSLVPIVEDDRLVGMISGRELRSMMLQEKLDMLLIAEEVAHPAVTVCPRDSLLEAVRKMTANTLEEIIAVAPNARQKIVGVISQRDIVLAYNREMVNVVRQEGTENSAASHAGEVHGFRDLIVPHQIVLDLKPGSKEEIVQQLVRPLVDGGDVKHPEALVASILDREGKMTTAIAPGVALPHAQHLERAGLAGARIVVGVCPDGTDFDAIDHAPTRLFFLICSIEQSTHLRMMAQLAKLIRNPETVEDLCRADSTHDMVKAITHAGKQS